MSKRFDPLLGFSPAQIGLGSGVIVVTAYAFGPDNLGYKESIKQGVITGVGMFAIYSVIDAIFN